MNWTNARNRIGPLLLAMAVLATTAPCPAAPNVIVIVADDLGWADLACYGSKYHRTPNLDRLAAAGMRFTESYSACPVCSPTRAALMTGKYPARLHLTDWLPGRGDRPAHRLARPAFRQELPLEEVTIAEMLHAAGYTTGEIGKWHLGGAGFEPSKQGFDFTLAGDDTGSPRSYFAPYEKDGRRIPGLADAPEGEYLTDRLTAAACEFVSANRERPFFLYLPHYAVHTPLAAPVPLIDEFRSASPHSRPNNPIYAAMLASLDAGVGRLLDLLDELKIADNTIVVFTSDNGGLATVEGPNTPATSNAPLREGKGYLYEGGIRVPLIVKWPGVTRAGSESSIPVSSIDLLPTLAEACGAKLSAPVDGVSLVTVLRGGESLERDALFWHYPHYSNQGGRPGGAIRRGVFKLIEFYEQGRLELFDVRRDPSENVNLALERPELTAELQSQLAAWRSQVGAQMMEPNPKYAPNPQGEDGIVALPAATADVHGAMLRYEPLPHKNTLGFWVRADDWASWEFDLRTPGMFDIVILQGCGPGSGGSTVEINAAEQTVSFTVQETRGFQDFIERTVGQLRLTPPGRITLTVKARSKPGPAVMDLRQVRLVPTN